jgi:hypothetical protein
VAPAYHLRYLAQGDGHVGDAPEAVVAALHPPRGQGLHGLQEKGADLGRHQVGRGDNEGPGQGAPQFQFFEEHAGHHCLAGAGIVGQQEAQATPMGIN